MVVVAIVGLAGGIASGKSTLASLLERSVDGRARVFRVDADREAHCVYEPGTQSYAKIRDVFGRDVVEEDGRPINRKALGSIVFCDASKMKLLTDIVWPALASRLGQIVDNVKQEVCEERVIVLIEAAVLIEAGWYHRSVVPWTEIWVTQAPELVRIQRLIQSRNLTEEDAKRRIASQISDAERAKHADLVIDTTQSKQKCVEILQNHIASWLL